MTALSLPGYRRDGLRTGIVHFGVGNFHRAHQAMYIDKLLEAGGAESWGICGVGLLPGDAKMRDALVEQDFRYTLVERDSDVVTRARSIASIIDYVYAPDAPEVVVDRLAAPNTRIVTLTITEGGYVDSPLDDAPSVFSYLVDGLARRRGRGIPPFTVVSCDNIEANGQAARSAVVRRAARRDPVLATWIEQNVRFPNSMVDRITPATTDADRAFVAANCGVQDRVPVVAEPFAQWIVEDEFPAGRPQLGDVGVQLVKNVVPYERMKLRLLNASHQALAYTGLLAGHRFVHQAVRDPVLRRLASVYAASEAQPTVGEPPGIDLARYREDTLDRFANAAIKDTLVRIASDGSDRLEKFLFPVVRDNATGGRPSPFAAFIVASFALVCADPELRGAIPDRSRDRLDAAVQQTTKGPAWFLADRELFAGLDSAVSFREDFDRAYAEIHALGVLQAAGLLLARHHTTGTPRQS